MMGMGWTDSFIHSHLLGGSKYSNVRFVVCKSGFRFGLGGGPTKLLLIARTFSFPLLLLSIEFFVRPNQITYFFFF